MNDIQKCIFRKYKKGILISNLYAAVRAELPLVTEKLFGEAVVDLCKKNPFVSWNPMSRYPLVISDKAYHIDLSRHTDKRLFQGPPYDGGFGNTNDFV